MATSAGAITFGIEINADRINSQLQAALTPALQVAQQSLNARPLHIRFDVDTGGIEAQLREVTRDRRINIDLNLQVTPQQIAALRAIRNIRDQDTRARVRVDLDIPRDIQERLVRLAPALRALHGLSDVDIRVRINLDDVDTERLERIGNALRELRDRRVSVNVDDEEARARVERLRGLLAGIGTSAAVIGAAGAALAGLGGAAGVAAGAVGGLVAGLAAIGPAAAAIGVTALVGLSGIKDAFSALNDISENSASEARDQADKIAAAQDQLASAMDGAEQAQRSLNSAQREARSAAEGVGQAYRDAEKELKNYQLTVEEASLDEREAVVALEEARKAAQQLTFDPAEREKAAIRVRRAEIDLAKAQEKNRETQDKYAEAQRKGVENSDLVVAAKEKQRRADEQVEQAASGVARANRQVAAAQKNLADATNGATPSVEKFNDALARLSPNAQAVVLAFRDFGPVAQIVKNSIQDALLANLANDLRTTAVAVLPAFATGMLNVATELNAAARQALAFAASARGIDAVNITFTNTTLLLRGLREGTGNFADGLIDAGRRATPFMQELGRSTAGIFDAFGRALSQSAQLGQLDAIFKGLSGTLQGAGVLLQNLTGALLTIGAEVLPTLQHLFNNLGAAITEIAPELGKLGKIFSEQIATLLPDLGKFVAALAHNLQPILPILADLFRALFNAVTPILPSLSRIVQIVGDTLVKSIQILQPALGPIVDTFATLFRVLQPIVEIVARNLSVALQILAALFKPVFDALQPVLDQLSQQLKPVLDEIGPKLTETARIIGQALADAITQLAPQIPGLVKSFADLFAAIAPVLPPLIQMVTSVWQPLIGILAQLIPVITGVVDGFTFLISNVLLPIVVPAVQYTTDIMRILFGAINDGINFITDTAFPKFIEGLKSVGGWFGSIVNGIRTVWDTLKEAVSDPINFVIETVWNNGLLRAWNTVRSLLGGVLGEATPLQGIPRRAGGGPVPGNGAPRADDVLLWGSSNEHMLTVSDVLKAGGHNIIFAIRDMIQRGIPFTWDNGKIITQLGKANLDAYGAAVAQKGYGNVAPEGLFDQLLPRFQDGGPVMPWMRQLFKGHEFARLQHGRPYQWAGPRFAGDSFDCCLIGDTMVLGPDGATPISEVRPGDRVWSYVDGTRVVSTVTAQWFSKRQETFKVRTRNKQVTGSANHPFMRLVKTADWHPVRGGKRGEILPDQWEVQWARLDELQPGDLLITPNDMGAEPKPHPTLADGSPVDADVAWLAGLFIGDGWTSERDVRICAYGDLRERAERILKRLGASSTGQDPAYGIFAYGVELARIFAMLNGNRRSWEKRIPGQVWTWPAELQRAFLNGYCDADGHKPANQSKHGVRTYASSSSLLMAETRALHMMLGDAVSNVSTNHRVKPITIKGRQVKNARPLHSFTVWAGKRKGNVALAANNTGIRVWLDSNDFMLSPVLAIEAQGEADTYDIEVGDSHNFVADGVVVHNSGFMASIAAAILGQNPWQRYWSTASFGRGQRGVGPQGFTAGIDNGFVIGVTDDPGGPGGGHTAGVLGAIPALGIAGAARVEAGGQRGDVHYGEGPDPRSFLAQYHLPIGANGFFDPGPGATTGGRTGPSTDQQSSFLSRQIERVVHAATAPVRELIKSRVGDPPPMVRAIPPGVLDVGERAFTQVLTGAVGKLGNALGGAWQKATDLGDKILDLVPFDSGGIASGTGFMPKNVLAPERILSPEQTKLFEALVLALQSVAGGAGVAGTDLLTAGTFQDGIATLGRALGIKVPDGTVTPQKSAFLAGGGPVVDENGQILSDTKDLLERTASSQALVDAKRFEQTQAVLTGIANLLTEKVLAPVVQAGMEAAFRSISSDAAFNALGRAMGQTAGQIIAAAVAAAGAARTTAALGGVLPGYTPGRDVHLFTSPTGGQLALSGGEAIMVPEWTRAIGGPREVARINAAARRGVARAAFSRGGMMRLAAGGTVKNPESLGADLLAIDQSTLLGAVLGKFSNTLVAALLKVIGIEIEVRDTMNGLAKDIRAFKGDTLAAFDESGQLISDTSGLVERTASSQEKVEAERTRIAKEIIAGVIKFLVTTVLLPVLKALSSSLITAATSAIGGAIGGPAGAIAGAVAGAALSGLADVFVSAIGAVISAGVDSVFDDGGIASGAGFIPKRTLAPERVLSPRTTESFDRLVSLLEAGTSRVTVNAPFTVAGSESGGRAAHDRLLSLLNN